eukprot:1160628-Pyramimonas_sp.AAC.1
MVVEYCRRERGSFRGVCGGLSGDGMVGFSARRRTELAAHTIFIYVFTIAAVQLLPIPIEMLDLMSTRALTPTSRDAFLSSHHIQQTKSHQTWPFLKRPRSIDTS